MYINEVLPDFRGCLGSHSIESLRVAPGAWRYAQKQKQGMHPCPSFPRKRVRPACFHGLGRALGA